jgi:hypothetical protein
MSALTIAYTGSDFLPATLLVDVTSFLPPCPEGGIFFAVLNFLPENSRTVTPSCIIDTSKEQTQRLVVQLFIF